VAPGFFYLTSGTTALRGRKPDNLNANCPEGEKKMENTMEKSSVLKNVVMGLLKPLMNQRGDTGGGKEGGGKDGAEGGADQPYIPGTTYKTAEEAAKGIENLNQVLNKQGNELGTLRKQNEVLTKTLEQKNSEVPKPVVEKEKGTDYSGQKVAVQKEINELDPMADGYQKTLSGLIGKISDITAAEQHDKTLGAASSIFKKELDDRDIKATHKAFLDKNPTFNTPEMQTRIKEYLAKDDTGMSDPLVAFREIQRDDIAVEAKKLKDENDEMKKVLDLQKGKDATGKVITKGTQTVQVTKPAKVTGAALDQGMKAALDKANSAA
jgi:hypothetical protein